jgi:hypothetical protein
MKLHKLHVLQRHAGAQGHGIAVTSAGMRGRAGLEHASAAAGGQHGLLGTEAVQGAVFQTEGEQAAAGTVFVHQQVNGEVFDEKLRLVLQALLVKRVQDGMAGAVSGGAGTRRHLAFGAVRGVPAELALVDAPVLGA